VWQKIRLTFSWTDFSFFLFCIIGFLIGRGFFSEGRRSRQSTKSSFYSRIVEGGAFFKKGGNLGDGGIFSIFQKIKFKKKTRPPVWHVPTVSFFLLLPRSSSSPKYPKKGEGKKSIGACLSLGGVMRQGNQKEEKTIFLFFFFFLAYFAWRSLARYPQLAHYYIAASLHEIKLKEKMFRIIKWSSMTEKIGKSRR
jgi:hypothetical protein